MKLLRKAVRLGAKEQAALLPSNRRLVGIAELGGRLDQRLQHRLKIERRAADDFEHVGGGGLLLERLTHIGARPAPR